jgi:hypothetical protein
MKKNKIIVYENDLKFGHINKLDLSSNLIEYASNDIKNKSSQIMNTIEYRLNDAKKNNFMMIDLSHLSLSHLNIIFTKEHFNNCEILFLNNNKLCGHIDFSNFSNLKVLDIESNNIESIKLPRSLIELTASNNNIERLQSDLINLERLIINNNKFKILEEYSNLELLDCNTNKIDIIKYYPKIKKIIVHNNPLKIISLNPTLSNLDIADCPIEEIPVFPNLKHLVASNTKLSEINPQMINLEFIEIIGTPIKRLSYFENFDIILVSSNLTKSVSSKYKNISNAIVTQKGSIVSISKNLSQ